MQTASAAMVCRMTHKPLAPPRPAGGEGSDSKRSAAERTPGTKCPGAGEGALPRVRACRQAPSPDLLRFASAPLANRPLPARGERLEQAARALPPPSSEPYAISPAARGRGGVRGASCANTTHARQRNSRGRSRISLRSSGLHAGGWCGRRRNAVSMTRATCSTSPRRGEVDLRTKRSKSGEGARVDRESLAPSPQPSPRRGEGARRVRCLSEFERRRWCGSVGNAVPKTRATCSTSPRRGEVDLRSASGEGARADRESLAPSPQPSPRRGEGARRVRCLSEFERRRWCGSVG